MIRAALDIRLSGGTLLDGTGGPAYVGDVGIVDDRIVAVGDLSAVVARETHDISGKVLSPGFIDVHTHDDNAVLNAPQCAPKISQGVTTVIVGNCGISAAPVRLRQAPPEPLNLLGKREDFSFDSFARYVAAVEMCEPAVNVAALVGHTSLRINHVADLTRPADRSEAACMRNDMEQAMVQGAIGLSTGLAYDTAMGATTEEVIDLARIAAEHRGLYVTHLRSEFDQIIEALEESFTIGSAAKVPVVVSHLKCAGPQNWGRSPEVLAAIEASPYRDHVHMDCYPYSAGSSNLDLKQVDERINILITRSEPHPEKARKTLAQIAAEWGVTQMDAARELMPAGAVYFSIDEQDMRNILCHPKTMIGSDGLPLDPHPHPRLYGSFPRVLGKYVRDESILSLPQAVHKMTGLPASIFGLGARGRIAAGYHADLVVFDPDTVNDAATFDHPVQPAVGIELVLVNGAIAFEDGQTTDKRRGRYIGHSRQEPPSKESS
jgi:N-acyl-D-aspartate/D-glutamate deacylase